MLRFGVIFLGSLWESFWHRFGLILVLFWYRVDPILGSRGKGPVRILSFFKQFDEGLDDFWTLFEPFSTYLGLYRDILGPFWDKIGSFCGDFGPFFGAIRGHFGVTLGSLWHGFGNILRSFCVLL